jgi:hypothetical protein
MENANVIARHNEPLKARRANFLSVNDKRDGEGTSGPGQTGYFRRRRAMEAVRQPSQRPIALRP